MGQPAHPHGTRVNSIQVASNAFAWNTRDEAFYFQSYFLALLFKFIRHWMTAGLLMPYLNPWFPNRYVHTAKLRSRRATIKRQDTFPVLKWSNNLPLALRKADSGRILDGVAVRYFRQLPPRLILREDGGDLMRPLVNIRRPRCSFTY